MSRHSASPCLSPPGFAPAIQYPNANYEESGPAPAQQPDLLDALERLRGKSAPAANADLAELLANAVPGKDFLTLAKIPDADANFCSTVQQDGFYADESTDCQGKIIISFNYQ